MIEKIKMISAASELPYAVLFDGFIRKANNKVEPDRYLIQDIYMKSIFDVKLAELIRDEQINRYFKNASMIEISGKTVYPGECITESAIWNKHYGGSEYVISRDYPFGYGILSRYDIKLGKMQKTDLCRGSIKALKHKVVADIKRKYPELDCKIFSNFLSNQLGISSKEQNKVIRR